MKNLSRVRPGYRPVVEFLEGRWQPGTVLSGELAMSLWAPGLAFLDPTSGASANEQQDLFAAAGVVSSAATALHDPVGVVETGRAPAPVTGPEYNQITTGNGAAVDLAQLAAVPATLSEGGGQSQRGCPINYLGGFPDTPGNLTANGSGFFNSSLAILTYDAGNLAGSIFSNQQVDVTSFYTYFYFQITPGSNPVADGMAFVIQRVGATALGPSGGGLGYGPDQPGGPTGILNSVAVKFDVYSNAGEGVNSTGLYRNGVSPTVPAYVLNNTGIDLRNLDVYSAELLYDNNIMDVTITNLNTNAAASQTYRINLPLVIGGNDAHVGFTGGTGGLTANQYVLGWIYC